MAEHIRRMQEKQHHVWCLGEAEIYNGLGCGIMMWSPWEIDSRHQGIRRWLIESRVTQHFLFGGETKLRKGNLFFIMQEF